MVERVTVSEHYLAVEYVPVRPGAPREAARDGGVDTDVGWAKPPGRANARPTTSANALAQ